MPLVTWKDLAYCEVEGPVRFRDHTLSIRHEHIALWRDDPDGRFKLQPGRGGSSAELGRFFPSL